MRAHVPAPLYLALVITMIFSLPQDARCKSCGPGSNSEGAQDLEAICPFPSEH